MTPSIATSIFAVSALCQPRCMTKGLICMKKENSELKLEARAGSELGFQDMATVEELFERIVRKDVDALSELYDAHAGLLMSVISKILTDRTEAEDILQESFLTIWNKAGMYKSHLGKPTSWMVTLAKNKAYDRYRKLVRQSDGMSVLKDSALTQSSAVDDSNVLGSEELQEGFRELNADEKVAIELVFYQGYTQQETADKLEAPLGTVKARIRRGLLKLKEFLNNNSSN